MADGKFNMDGYVPVSERIDAFYRAHPEGSMQSEIVELTADRVTVKAYAYRTVDDLRPGIGHSSLEIPGKTPYTRGSEIENAETSAWGRAIAALGFEVKRGLASAEEVRNKQPEQRGFSVPRAVPAQSYRRDELAALMAEKHLDLKAVEGYADRVGIEKGQRATNEQMDALIDAVSGNAQPSSGVPTVPADGGAVPEGAAPPTTPPVDGSMSTAATAQGSEDAVVSPGTSSDPASAPTFEDVLRVSGGVEEPPAPGSAAKKAPRTVEEAIADAESKAKVTA